MVVYQIFVDRFEKGIEKKEDLYPTQIKNWEKKPHRGKLSPKDGCYTHEMEFWGGDLVGITNRLSYLKDDLGIDAIYLTPICKAYTNHKYDTIDYFQIDPQFGTLKDLKTLVQEAHKLGIQVILDCVFNHVGKKSPWFESAVQNPNSEYRNFFSFSDSFRYGYKAWGNVANLPELNLENPLVQEKILEVAAHYLAIVDGLRLDVAFELGPEFLQRITEMAHKIKPNSKVIGEIWSYPGEWLQKVDGLMNYHLRQLIIELIHGNIECLQFGRIIEKMIQDSGIESICQCWNILSSHDTMRLKNLFPKEDLRKIALVLQFTLPGIPMIYYGEELGMSGGDDPLNRGSMQWKSNEEENQDWNFYQKLIALRNRNPALTAGSFVLLETKSLLAFCRKTKLFKEMILVIANTQSHPVQEVLSIPEYRLTNSASLKDLESDKEYKNFSGCLKIELPPRSFAILSPVIEENAC